MRHFERQCRENEEMEVEGEALSGKVYKICNAPET